jgi:hypothetical protein
MSRDETARHLNMMRKGQRRQRLSAADRKPPLRDDDEPGVSLASAAQACGTPNNVNVRPRKVVHGSVTGGAKPLDATASTAGMDLPWLLKELQRQLEDRVLEHAILTEALEVARQTSDSCAQRHRR